MDDHYRMIEQDIESLLHENADVATLVPIDMNSPMTMKPDGFLPYKCAQTIASRMTPNHQIGDRGSCIIRSILSQYTKWSTVESDESGAPQFVEQPYVAPTAYNLTVEMMQNILVNFWNAQLRQTMTKMTTKRVCTFCKKNGMSV